MPSESVERAGSRPLTYRVGCFRRAANSDRSAATTHPIPRSTRGTVRGAAGPRLVTDGEAVQAAFPYLARKYRVSLDCGDYCNWVLSGLQTEVCAKRDFRPKGSQGIGRSRRIENVLVCAVMRSSTAV